MGSFDQHTTDTVILSRIRSSKPEDLRDRRWPNKGEETEWQSEDTTPRMEEDGVGGLGTVFNRKT